ncbi:SDR family NAD(P)-dependent oxidoreductase [Cohnella sp. JJ-181]|uniref:SDR family NAD(P)-dependent oxidoreductase n=1 Tax=Cohnella rhizoplanae TaxID=2974897 RepID=UPI0022FF5FE9|nr:SDR family oxidoreductase [Cohnella sp. JJ-181]CAI6085132.1 Dihydroanticapsin 7-dehydrogenase [Cohnella sp. JJ-181]
MTGRYAGRTVIVTGAAGGIGRHLSRAYAEAGASVALSDVPGAGGEALAAELTDEGYAALYLAADLTEAAAAQHIVERAAAWTGRIDALVHNAGIGIWKSPLELTLEEWDRVMSINLRGAFLCGREAAKAMKRTGGGAIVNVASTRAMQSEPNSEAYAASKGGILALTHALAMSLGPDGIAVNAVSPGWIETGDYDALRPVDHEQHPAGRVGRPADVVRACFYLTDPDGGFVTGTNLVVDGGMTRKMIYEP